MLVFVYGSLKSGFHNHRLLKNSKFVGQAVTKEKYTMYSCGSFPSVTEEPSYNISGEVYEINEQTLKSLDYLEGYEEGRKNNFYERKLTEVLVNNKSEVCFIYFGSKTSQKLQKGFWEHHSY